jgi:hypothetical protein
MGGVRTLEVRTNGTGTDKKGNKNWRTRPRFANPHTNRSSPTWLLPASTTIAGRDRLLLIHGFCRGETLTRNALHFVCNIMRVLMKKPHAFRGQVDVPDPTHAQAGASRKTYCTPSPQRGMWIFAIVNVVSPFVEESS